MKPEVATRGILNPREGFRHFRLTRHPPSEALAPFVDGFWIVRRDLRGFQPRRSAVHGQNRRMHIATAIVRAVEAERALATVEAVAATAGLSHFDQAHLSRDFKAQLGRTPSDYVLACAAAGAPAVTSRSTSGARPGRGRRGESP